MSTLFSVESFDVKVLYPTPENAEFLWTKMAKRKTFFHDFDRGNADAFKERLTMYGTEWFEVWRSGQLAGIVWVTGLHEVLNAYLHTAFFDNNVQDKLAVTKAIIEHLFSKYALWRLTAIVPEIHFASHRMYRRIGFRPEGRLRQAVLMGGNKIDLILYGLLRNPE